MNLIGLQLHFIDHYVKKNTKIYIRFNKWIRRISKNNLLKHYGSISKIKRASIESLNEVDGIGIKTAKSFIKNLIILMVKIK